MSKVTKSLKAQTRDSLLFNMWTTAWNYNIYDGRQAMESLVERQYREYTRYLKPLRPVSFSDLEMMQSLMQSIDPEEVASVAQLLGHRRGVIRITFKTSSGVERLETVVQRRQLAIGDVPLGLVDYGGQFIVVTLDNVPHFIPDEEVRETIQITLCTM